MVVIVNSTRGSCSKIVVVVVVVVLVGKDVVSSISVSCISCKKRSNPGSN